MRLNVPVAVNMHAHRMARLMVCLLAVFVSTSIFAAAWEAPYVDDGIARCIAAARKLKDMSKFGARSDGMCLVAGFMEVGGELSWTCKLQGGKEYIFVASGDQDVKDLDLEAWEAKKKVAEDTAEDNVPVVVLTVENDCSVTMKMKLDNAPKDEVHFCVMVMLENEGTGGSLKQLEKVAKQLNVACAAINEKGDLQFDQESNSICIMAGLIESEDMKSFHRDFQQGSYLIVGAGDDNCKDFDLELHVGGRLIKKDEEEDATPILAFDMKAKARGTVKMIMHESTKPSFSVVGILTPK